MTADKIKSLLRDRVLAIGVREVARALDISPSQVSRKLSGDRPLTIEDAAAIARACGLTLRLA